MIYGIAAVITGICDIVIYIKEERFIGFGPGNLPAVRHPQHHDRHHPAGLPRRRRVDRFAPVPPVVHSPLHLRLTHLGIIRMMAGSFYYTFSLVVNILGLVLGVLMLLQPFLALFTLGYMVGFLLMAFGIDCILMAFTDLGSRW